MTIDQRNNGAAVTTNTYCPDRWRVEQTTDGAFSAQQISDAPAGFVNSLRWTVTTADASLAATQYATVRQGIEGFNIADFNWGTANAKTVTLSFWVKSSLTGTFGGIFGNNDFNRSYPFTYTITSANTWEQKSITIAGDTTGTWNTTNSAGIQIYFGLGVGSTYSGTAGSWQASGLISATGAVNLMGTLNATWQITGVQLEVGTTATSFEYLDYGNILRQCQRYCYAIVNSENATGDGGVIGWGYANTGNQGVAFNKFPVSMRTSPSLTTIASAGALEVAYWNAGVTSINSNTVTTNSGLTTRDSYILIYTSANFADGTGQHLRYSNSPTSTLLFFSAEL
jgi:hypothetical protein